MIKKGSKVRVVNTDSMCCGTTMQGNVGVVKQGFQITRGSEDAIAIVLDDDSLHWLDNLEEVND